MKEIVSGEEEADSGKNEDESLTGEPNGNDRENKPIERQGRGRDAL